ncbi:MAG: ABC transporter permease, partial [Bacilli bacterium]
MWKFIIRRVLIMIPQLFLISIIVFALGQAMPGDVLTPLTQDPKVSAERIEELRVQLGLDDPIPEQYIRWISGVVQGDWGKSFLHKMPVTELIGERLENTALLGGLTVILIYLIAVPLGIISGRYTNSLADKAITMYGYTGFATPIFIFALIMLYFLGYQWSLFPTGGSVDPLIEVGTSDYYWSKFQHLLLPALSDALISTVFITQILRNEMIDNKFRDFTRTARSKGISESRIYNSHVARNSLVPIAANVGYSITGIIGGAIIIESIFVYPGIGRLFIDSVMAQDYPVMTALVLLSSFATLLGTLLSDIILSIV